MVGVLRFILFLVFLPSFLFAQMPLNVSRYVDSLKSVAENKSLNDSLRSDASFGLSGYFSEFDLKQAKTYFQEGNRLGKKYPFLMAGAPFYEAFLFPDDFTKAELLYKKADTLLSAFSSANAYSFRAKLWLNYASLQQYQDKNTEMVNIIINKAIPMAKKAGNDALVSYMYSDLALALSNNEKHETAITYYKLAIEGLIRTKKQSSRVADVYAGAAYAYCELENYNMAAIMLAEARKQLSPFPKSPSFAIYYANEAMYYNRIKRYESAAESASKGLALASELKIEYLFAELLIQQFQAMKQLGRYTDAKLVFSRLSKVKLFNTIAVSKKDIYLGMAEIYAAQDSMGKAYYWQRRYSTLSDSLNGTNLKERISEMEIKFGNEENQRKIAALRSEKAEMEYLAKNRRLATWLLATAGMFSLLLTGLILLNFQKNKRLAAQERIQHQHQLKELAQQKQLQLSSALIEGEEKERARIARDLHDGLGGMLAGIKLQFAALGKQPGPLMVTTAAGIVGQLDQSLHELRRIAKNMMPVTLIKFGLEKAIGDLCMSLSNELVQIDFQSFGIDPKLPGKTQIMIYRIIQEVLANALKHAAASSIILQCSQNGNRFFITAEDDGRGFSTEKLTTKEGMGIENIKNRVEYLNGRIELSSVINEGTVINIELDVYS